MTREFQEPNISAPRSGSGRARPGASSGFVVGTEPKARVPLFGNESESTAARDPFAQGIPRSPDAGATLERQFLLADSRPWIRPERLIRLLVVALVVTTLAAVTAGSFLLYRDHEDGWQTKLRGVEAAVVTARNESGVLAGEVARANARVADKSKENEELAQLAQKTVVELQTSLAEARALRTKVSELEEQTRQLEAQRLADLTNLVPPFLREAWRKISNLGS